ncbi:MAG: malate synthase G [Paenibacillaceae bacterium]
MENYVQVGKLKVALELYTFINEEALPGSEVNQATFWSGFEKLISDLTPKNKALLAKRDQIQSLLNDWHIANKSTFNFESYKSFLQEINYWEPEVEPFQVTTEHVDEEVAIQAGPQLVVPVNNARYALNASNARWGSLYDAVYGTDVIPADEAHKLFSYNPARGEQVISYAREFLDRTIPLIEGSHKDAVRYTIVMGKLAISLQNGVETRLKDDSKLIGYQGTPHNPTVILFNNNQLHFEIVIDRNHVIGKTDLAGIKDIIMEAALTTIMDCEDSVTAVDAEDKVLVYRNWLGLMKGDLSADFSKGSQHVTRTMNPDREYVSITDGKTFSLRGRSLLFVRNVGHLMTINAILDQDGQEIPEGILDAVVTSLAAKHTLLGNGTYQNTTKGSIYIVKPKMHGSEEAAFANELFDRVEDLLGLNRHTLKIGVMDEERRTSLNLKACIRQVKDRIVFINTGFLDRTGDEMHTSMEAGMMIRKSDMKSSVWLQSYEHSNVMVGLDCGLQDHAQIGKGMWAMPDLMNDMVKQKIVHPQAGANTAWVPSPTAATLHAMHYHQVNVREVQDALKKDIRDYRNDILTIPVVVNPTWTEAEIQQELDNNAQGILGYVVRWVEQGVGCSKVPDINNVGLMEDRATLRISSQHMTNWLHHGICTKQQVMETFQRMAKVVDEQNAGDHLYHPMAVDYDQSIAFQAACELVFDGYNQPNGYTEPILHRRRLEFKARNKL